MESCCVPTAWQWLDRYPTVSMALSFDKFRHTNYAVLSVRTRLCVGSLVKGKR